ncbi:MAG: restriction endonuclease subunit S [Sphaerospermopsis kisseleviana]
MGKYQGYDKYKDSGVEWLGEIPQHWKSLKIKRLTVIKRGASPRPIDDPKYFDDDGEYAWVRIADVTASERYLQTTTQKLSELGKSFSVPLEPGQLFLSIAGSVGKPIITKIKCCIHDGFVYFPDLKVNQEFIYYIFYSGQPYLGLGKMGTQLNLNTETVGGITIGFPPLEEQEKIARFLDYKTKQIDELIAKKETLIEKLDEKRTSLISHAVTKGLDVNVSMKDSGIEWLGAIPEHWEVKRLRYTGFCQNGISKGADYFGFGYPFVNYTDVYANPELPKIVNGLANSTDEDRINYSVQTGDIFFTRTSETIEEIGITSTCLQSIDNATFSGFLIRVRPFANLIFPGFSKYYFRCQLHRFFFVKEMNLVTRASLSQELLKKLPVLLPPLQEQQKIAEYLDQKTAQIEEQKTKIQQAIDLLKEYRTALITNAVTGKIDVRKITIPKI